MKRKIQIGTLLLLVLIVAGLYWQVLLAPPVLNETDTNLPISEQTSNKTENDDVPTPALTQNEENKIELNNIGLYTVREVVDGDTVRIWDGSELLVVRVLGVDAPETERSPTGAECFNKEATAHARELLTGKEVSLLTDSSQDTFDTYGRLLAYLELSDGRDFGRDMLYGGYAKEYTFKGSAYARQTDYQAVEAIAKEGRVGLWSCE